MTKESKPPTEAIVPIPIGDLIPTPDNPRVLVDDQAIKSLAASIKSAGMLVPVLCRPHPTKEGKFDLRAGHRRLFAAALIGMNRIPAIIRDMDDKAAIEVTVIENLEREDLHPLDQGASVKAMLAAGWDAAEVGKRLGRSTGWVLRRATLADLLPKMAALTKKPDHPLAEVHIGVLEQVARLPVAMQKTIAAQFGPKMEWLPNYFKSPASCAHWIQNEFLMDLAKVPWDLNDEGLYKKAGTCNACPKRSKCQPALWDDVQDAEGIKPGRCLDASCFAEKGRRAMMAKMDRAKEAHPKLVLITTSDQHQAEAERKYFGKPVLQSYSVQRCKKSDKGARPALVITGAGAGTATWIREPRHVAGLEKAKAQPKTMKQKRAQLDDRRTAWVVDRMAAIVDERQKTMTDVDAMPKWVSKDLRANLFPLHVAFGGAEPSDFHNDKAVWQTARDWIKGKGSRDSVSVAALADLLVIWHARLRRHDLANLKRFDADLDYVASCLGIKVKDLRNASIQELPEPKAWAVDAAKASKAKPAVPGHAASKAKRAKAKASKAAKQEAKLKRSMAAKPKASKAKRSKASKAKRSKSSVKLAVVNR